MSRNRMIKKEFFSDEKIGKLSHTARLLFIGLWVFADDSGICRGNALSLKADIFRYDENINRKEIEAAINELMSNRCKLIYRLKYNDENYLWIKNFSNHQIINRPSTFRFINQKDVPDYTKLIDFTEDSLNTHGGLTENKNQEEIADSDQAETIDITEYTDALTEDSLSTHGGLTEYSRTKEKEKEKDKEESKSKRQRKRRSVKNSKSKDFESPTFQNDANEIISLFMSTFDEDERNRFTEKQIESWKDTIYDLMYKHHYTKEQIFEAITFARQNDFWARQFLSINKLVKHARDDDDKIKYISRFLTEVKYKHRKDVFKPSYVSTYFTPEEIAISNANLEKYGKGPDKLDELLHNIEKINGS